MSAYGKILPSYYDAFMKDETHITAPLKKLLKKHTIKPKKALEIGCGTGTILTSLPKKTKIYGVDLSKEMLAQAAKKIPKGEFIHANMTNFKLKEKFDLVLCMFDAINHLNTWQEWQKTIKNAANHLEKNGYFIFDVNSLERMLYLSRLGVYFGYPTADDGIVLTRNFFTKKKNTVNISFKIFLKQKGNTYTIIDENVLETGFPAEKIRKELERYFIVAEQLDIIVEKSNVESKRIFFVCRKP